MTKILSRCLLVFFSLCQPAFAQLSATLYPATLNIDDTTELVLTSDEPTATSLDLSPLQQNFDILGTERQTGFTLINGQARAHNTLILLLKPKHVGILSIPTFKVGASTSNAITVVVKPSPITAPTEALNTTLPTQSKLTCTWKNKETYLHQEALLTVRFYQGEYLADTHYTAPTSNDGLLIPVGEMQEEQGIRNGHPYVVETQQYAFFPQKSGTITLSPPMLKGVRADRTPYTLQAKMHALSVKPAQFTDAHAWLPAHSITMTAIEDKPQKTLHVGDVFTRVITLRAVGLPAPLLPVIKPANGPFSVYQTKSTAKNTFEKGHVVSTNHTTYRYLLNQTGDIVIPQETLDWFNTTTGKMEKAVLLAQKLYVNGHVTSKAPTSSPPPALKPPSYTLPWSMILGMMIISGLCMIWFWHRRRPVKMSPRQARQALKKACFANDPIAAKHALLRWARAKYPKADIIGLADLRTHLNKHQLPEAIDRLLSALYSKDAGHWAGKSLWQAVK